MPKIPTSVLNESVTIQRLSGSSVDDRGLSTATFSDNSTSVQCRITHQSGQETLADGRIEINDIFLMTVSPDVDITTQDRVVWETRFFFSTGGSFPSIVRLSRPINNMEINQTAATFTLKSIHRIALFKVWLK